MVQGCRPLPTPQEHCYELLAGYGNLQRCPSPSPALAFTRDFPCCLLTPLLPCNAHCRHGSTSPVPQPAAPHGAARPGSPPSSGSLAAPWRALLTTGIASLRRADVLHYLPESTNRFSQPLSLLNCKEKAPSPTG